MQLCIITALDAHRKTLRDKYADSIANIDGPIIEGAPATETNEATTDANSIAANTQPCLGLSCTIKRLSQGPTARTGRIPANHQHPATAKCPRCSTTTTAIALATTAETAINGDRDKR
jgi:hypothetical protein